MPAQTATAQSAATRSEPTFCTSVPPQNEETRLTANAAVENSDNSSMLRPARRATVPGANSASDTSACSAVMAATAGHSGAAGTDAPFPSIMLRQPDGGVSDGR